MSAILLNPALDPRHHIEVGASTAEVDELAQPGGAGHVDLGEMAVDDVEADEGEARIFNEYGEL